MAFHANGGSGTGADGVHYNGLPDATDMLAVSFRFRSTQTDTNTGVLAWWTPGSRLGFGFIMNNTAGKMLLIGYDGSSQRLSCAGATTTVNDGAWHHIFANLDIRSGNSNAMHIDGNLEASATSSGDWSCVSGNVFQVGSLDDGFWAKPIADYAEVAYWDRVNLDAGEIAALAAGYSPQLVRPQNLILYAPLVRSWADKKGANLSSGVGTAGADHPRALGGAA